MTVRRITVLAATLVGLVVVASACASGLGSGGAGWPQGRVFLSTSVTENGVPRDLVAGTRISLDFGERGSLLARGGCNTLVGQGRLDGSTLVLGDLSQTDMGCPDGRGAQDAWLADLLMGRPTLTLTGDELTLTRGATVITFLDREVADPDRPLAGTRWTVHTLVYAGTASSVPPGALATLLLDPAGTFQATTGCPGGELRGTWTTQNVVRQLSLTVTSDTPCSAGTANIVDLAVRLVFAQPMTYGITAKNLRLDARDGTGLGLTATS